MPENNQIGVENDNNFIGFSSRLDPSNLNPGYSQSSKNMRLQRGAAQPRKGCERLTSDELNDLMQSGSGYYIDKNGQDNIVLLFSDGMILFNTQTETFSQKYTFPAGRYLPISYLSSQTSVVVTGSSGLPPQLTYTAYLNVQTTIGLKIGDKIRIGKSLYTPNVTYVDYTIIDLTGTRIYYYSGTDQALAPSGTVSVIIPSISFDPEMVQALESIYIFRGVAGPLISATVTNPSIQTGQTVSITVTTASPHGLRVGSEVSIQDLIPPFTHKYWHKNVLVASIISATQFTFLFTNPNGSTIQAHTNLAGFNVQQANPPMAWDSVSNSFSIIDQTGVNPDGVTYPLPCGEFGLYFQNRIVVKTNSTQIIATDILSQNYDPLNTFTINQGGNDTIIGVLPWIENQFLVFMAKSIYVAFLDPRFDETAPDQSQVTVVTTEVGCLARHSIVPAGQFVFFFSGKGIHMLTPQLDLKLLGNTMPLSEPIDDYFDNVNFDYAKKVTAIYFDNRFFIAFPVNGGIKNNSILVYNTLNQAWESIDTYPSGLYIDNFVAAFYRNKRRLFIIANIGKPVRVPLSGPIPPGQPTTFLAGQYGGIFLAEELESGDEFTGSIGSPLLPFSLPATLTAVSYIPNPVVASIRSREYTFGSQMTKRFSKGEFNFSNQAGDDVSIYVTVHDTDATEEVLRYVFTGSSQIDGTLRPRIALRGVSIDTEVVFNLGRPALKGTSIYAINSNRGMITEE
jgi:hypothetical protein